MVCQKKNKKLLVFCLSFLLFCLAVIPCLLSVESYASETSTISTSEYFRTHNFYDTCAYVCRKYASFPYVDYLTGSSSGITYDAFADYLESIGKSDLLQGDVIVNEASGGRGYDLPQDLRQEMLNFVQNNYIADNPLNFKQCYIRSYNNLNSSLYSNFNQYSTIKEYIKNSNGFVLMNYYNRNGQPYVYLYTLPNYDNVGLYGSTSDGLFTNVSLSQNWSTINYSNYRNGYGTVIVVNPDGSTTTPARNVIASWQTLKNLNTPQLENTNTVCIMSNKPNDELVYVFETLNAYKNYNSGSAQSYYMPSNSQSIVPYYDGFTDKDLATAGNFYNNIVINTSGDSPNDIRKKTDSILGSLDGLFGDTESESSGGLFDSLGDIITGATGAISPIKEIVLGDIKELVADVFDFLPPTIITLWVSGIVFGIFFGVLKLIRG